MTLHFNSSPSMTLGVELEMQVLDAETKDLAPGAPLILEKLGGESARIKPELFQSTLEINTGICDGVNQVRNDLARAISQVRGACDDLGFELASAGSHPAGCYSDRIIYPKERYLKMIDRNRWVVQRMLIFGLHIHVGMRDGEHAMAMINAMLHYMPHLLALSASSPYWQGKDTGLASSRITVFEALPTAGNPCTFESWKNFERAYDIMIRSNAIKSIKDIWWDIRPHPDFGTIELRVCDSLPTLSEITALVALAQALYAWFDDEYRNGRHFSPPSYWMLRENKWRASRWGLDAEIILDADGRTGLLRTEIGHLLEFLAPRASKLGAAHEFATLEQLLNHGASYERQRALRKQKRSLRAVIDALVEEFRSDAPMSAMPRGKRPSATGTNRQRALYEDLQRSLS